MSFSQRLVLWLHVAFVIFTIGPLTLAIMSTPRYIRRRDVRILRYLTRMTFVLGVASLAVLIAGFALASMLGKEGNWWVIVSATLFVVAVLLLGLIHRDQRHAIRALEATEATAGGRAHGKVEKPDDGERTTADAEAAPGPGADEAGAAQAAGASEASAAHLASVERGRIAMIGGVVALIWLVILVLMVWNS